MTYLADVCIGSGKQNQIYKYPKSVNFLGVIIASQSAHAPLKFVDILIRSVTDK